MHATAGFDFCQELPKAELHLHLEGAVYPGVMQELAPDLDAEEIRLLYQCSDFPGFLECFKRVNERLLTPEAYALVTRRLLERLHAENVRYAEIILSAGVILWKRQDFAAIFDAVSAAAASSAVEVRWIFDGIRHLGAGHVMEVARLAAERTGRNVVALGIGGDEERGPAAWFHDAYRFAAAHGLHLHAHAGETMGPASIWAALELGVERIGHGIRAIEDPVLVKHLRDRRIPLEVCVTSNVVTRAVPGLKEHPLRRLYDAGIPITLNSDDPGIFDSGLVEEYVLAAREFGFSETELEEIARNGFTYAFRPVKEAFG
jgi:adenosine deaminase/aminodeoxyfutalosine deaminase